MSHGSDKQNKQKVKLKRKHNQLKANLQQTNKKLLKRDSTQLFRTGFPNENNLVSEDNMN